MKNTRFFNKKCSSLVGLDLGVRNPFSEIIEQNNYSEKNSKGEDVDNDILVVKSGEFEIVTAFEILEHLVAPYISGEDGLENYKN